MRALVARLKEARPVMPPGFSNRLRMNWELQLAIADLAGGDWPKLARRAAIKLAHERREPSEGKRLLAAFLDLFSVHGSILASAEVQVATAQLASAKLRCCSIRMVFTLRKTERGYRVEYFAEAFRHYLPEFPNRKRATARDRRGKRRTVARLKGPHG